MPILQMYSFTVSLLIYREMAAASEPGPSDSLTADLFDCAVCMEDMSDRKPKNLTCGHSFCGRCLENIANGTRSILCPTCRAETFLPEEGVSGLPMNLFISKVKANVSGIIMRSSILCGMCLSQDRHTNAAHVCTDCQVNMCESCKDYHLKMGIFNEHNFTLLHSEETLCSDHRRAMEYVCLECKKGLCVHCTIDISHEAHIDKIKQMESGMEVVKETLNFWASHMREMMKGIQDSAICLAAGQSTEITEAFSCLSDGLLKETDKYKFLHNWKKTYLKLEEIYKLSSNLTTNLSLYLKKSEKPQHKLPDVRVKPVHICTFFEQLASPGEVAFLDDNSVIYLDTEWKTVTRIGGIHHGILANYCLPNREEITCLAVQGKYFYLGGNKQVMKVPVMQNTEPSEYIKLPEVHKGLDQLQVLKDGTLVMKGKSVIRSFNPETKTVKTLLSMNSEKLYTFLRMTSDEKTLIITKPVQNVIYLNNNGTKYYVRHNFSRPMSTLVIENMVLVADCLNSRVVAFDTTEQTYLGEVLNIGDGLNWPVGLAYKAPYLCVTECNVDQKWARVKFYKWTVL